MKEVYGDIVEGPDRGIIIHGCNAQHVMGAGLAKQIRQKWHRVYDAYMATASLELGMIIPVDVTTELTVVNCITQEYHGRDGRRYVSYDAIRDCMLAVRALAEASDKEFLHIPLIGAGLAGGDWNEIKPIIEEAVPDSVIHKILWHRF